MLTAEGHVESIDASLRFEMTKSIVDKGSLEVSHPLARKGRDGRYYNYFGPLTSFIAIPFYVTSKIVHSITHFPQKGLEEFMFSMINPILGALTISIFFLFCIRIMKFESKKAFVGSLLFGFGSSFLFYTKYSANEIPCTLFLIIGCYFVLKENKKAIDWIFGGAGFGLAYLTRWESPLLLVPVVIWIIYKYFPRINYLILFLTGFLPFLAIGTLYCYSVFGKPFPLYEEPPDIIEKSNFLNYTFNFFTYHFSFPFLKGLYKRLFSLEQGLFIYNPFFIFSLEGFYYLWKREKSIFFLFLSIILIWIGFYALGSFVGTEMGPRYLVPIFFLFTLLAVVSTKKEIVETIFFSLIFLSFIINFLGINVSSHRTHYKVAIAYGKKEIPPDSIQEKRFFAMVEGAFEVWRNYIKNPSGDYFFSKEDASMEERLEKQATVALPNFWWVFLPFFGIPKIIVWGCVGILLIGIFYTGYKIRKTLFTLNE